MNKKKAIFWLAVVVLVAAMAWWIYGNFMSMIAKYQAMGKMFGEGQVVKVQADRCQRRDLTEYHDFTGTTQAVNSIEVRARVEGYLEAIHFTDGQFVDKGQLLFTIEPAPYVDRRNEAASRVKAAEAELERTRLDFERIQAAVKINAVSKQDLSRSQASYQTAQAAMEEANSALDRAELELSYTKIHSPIKGKIGRHLVDVGNLVSSGGAEKTLLTTIVQIEPIYVLFYAGEKLLQDPFLNKLLSGSEEASIKFNAGLSEESDYPHEGQIKYIDNTVDPMTGTILIRGQLQNEKRSLLPGMFMRVRVGGQVHKNAVVVQEEAIITDLNGKYMLVIGKNNIVQRRNVKLGMPVEKMRQITEGLTGDESYVISGQHKVRAGMPVEPYFGQIPAEETKTAGKTAGKEGQK